MCSRTETRSYIMVVKDYPILTNEIMTGLKEFDNKYLTPMTTGALKDLDTINDLLYGSLEPVQIWSGVKFNLFYI